RFEAASGTDHEGPQDCCEGSAMTRYQRARRIAYWRGSGVALLLATLWMLASAYASHLTQ
ncbi:hypothetical protein, partial [Pseudomonas viridiflava]|uniref:hypothetical protein n=1 Tax=Pseudomonas viridiflava TaxID=33069 RepID=UPI000F08A7B8